MRSRLLLAVAALVTFGSPANPADTRTANTLRLAAGEKPAAATIADMAWYAGRWTGSGFGGENEEVWTPPNAGTMLGMYRLVKDGKPVFFELLTILEEQGSLLIRLKHF